MSAIPRLCIFISSAAANAPRRHSLRKSWFRYLEESSPLPEIYRKNVMIKFVMSFEDRSDELACEEAQYNDIVFVNAPQGYQHLWRKALAFLAWLEERAGGLEGGGGASGLEGYDYVMHADDDSFVRLDLLLPLMKQWPRERLYWGYLWDGTGNRVTTPIRNPGNKSYMPADQYPLDFYPTFASGCGFVLSRDLVQALLATPLPDYRLLDPPFGIHLCGPPGLCVLSDGPVKPVHDERVRPYRPLPIFRTDSLVQHYLRPEEMRPFYMQALAAARGGVEGTPISADAAATGPSPPAQLYDQLVAMGLLRR